MTEQLAPGTAAQRQAQDALQELQTLVVAGCGLLGTSVARASREAFPGARIVGIDSSSQARAEAADLSVYDQVVAAVGGVDLSTAEGLVAGIVATPPAHIAGSVRQLSPLCGLVMDVGSIKAPVIDALRADGGLPANFVPCHPMAGSHRQGPASGDASLFARRWVFVVSGGETSLTGLAHAFWQSLGAQTQEIDAQAHDHAVAYTSHLPHLLASAYMAVDTPDIAAAGTGFMEFTRLAKSNPEMWSQVLRSNRAAWRPLLASYIKTLEGLDALIENGDMEEIMSYLSARRDERFALDVPADEARSLV